MSSLLSYSPQITCCALGQLSPFCTPFYPQHLHLGFDVNYNLISCVYNVNLATHHCVYLLTHRPCLDPCLPLHSLQATCPACPSRLASCAVLSFESMGSRSESRRKREVSASGPHSSGHCWQRLVVAIGAEGMGWWQRPLLGSAALEKTGSLEKAAGAGSGTLTWEHKQMPDLCTSLLP